MSKKKTQKVIVENDENLGMQYLEDLSNDNKYSLSVDPDNLYDLSNEHKRFIELYSQYNNLLQVCALMDIEIHIGKDYLLRYSTQKELRRLNLALHHRKIATRIISYYDLGSYLSSWLIGDSVSESDKLNKAEKLQVMKLLMDWHKSANEFKNKPDEIIEATIEDELNELKASDIRELIQRKKLLSSIKKAEQEVKHTKPEKEEKEEKKQQTHHIDKSKLVEQIISSGEFSSYEIDFIKELSVEELKELIK